MCTARIGTPLDSLYPSINTRLSPGMTYHSKVQIGPKKSHYYEKFCLGFSVVSLHMAI